MALSERRPIVEPADSNSQMNPAAKRRGWGKRAGRASHRAPQTIRIEWQLYQLDTRTRHGCGNFARRPSWWMNAWARRWFGSGALRPHHTGDAFAADGRVDGGIGSSAQCTPVDVSDLTGGRTQRVAARTVSGRDERSADRSDAVRSLGRSTTPRPRSSPGFLPRNEDALSFNRRKGRLTWGE